MKTRILSLLLVFVMMFGVFGLSGCTQTQPTVAETQDTSKPVEATPVSTDEPKEVEEVKGIILTEEEKDLSVRDTKGKNGVVASANPYASKIGLDIMKQGGNAVDAAVGMAFTLGLVEPNASGPAGSGFMLIHDAKTGEQVFLDYLPSAPAALTQEIFESYEKSQKATGVASGIPGAVDGWMTALEQYGTMDIEQILEPIIVLAEEGYEMTPHLVSIVQDNYEKIMAHEETARVFLNDGLPYEAGEYVKNVDYANFLRIIAEEGRDGFYQGEVADAIVEAVQADGGLMTLEDLDNYKTAVREPIRTNYRGYEIITSAPSSAGGVPIIQGLNMAENFDFKEMGLNTSESLHIWSEIFKVIHADRYNFVGDPDFADVPLDALTSKEYAKDRIEAMNLEGSTEIQDPGLPFEYESPSTTHVSIMDKDGNMVSMTNTNNLYFGCAVTPKNMGFVLNTGVFNYSTSYEPNKVEPGKRARSTMAPTLVLKDGETFMTVGSPGGSRIPGTLLQIISNVIDHDMDIQTAINQPRMHQLQKKDLYLESLISEEVRAELEAIGHKLTIKGDVDSYFGGVQAIIRDQSTGEMHGGADPRRDGKALSY